MALVCGISLDLRLELQLEFGERVAASASAQRVGRAYFALARPEIHLTSWLRAMHADDRQLKPMRYMVAMVTVCTVLPPPERPRIDAAGDGCFDTCMPTPCGSAVRRAPPARRRRDHLVHRCHGERCRRRALRREFPPFPRWRLSRGTTARRRRRCSAWVLPVCAAPWTAPPDGWRRLRDLVGTRVAGRDPHPRSTRPGAGRPVGRNSAVFRGVGEARAGAGAPCAGWRAIYACGPAR